MPGVRKASIDPYVRKTAVLSLWNNGDTTFNDEVFHIAEADPDFRRVIINTFETRKDLKCVPLLIKLINKEQDTSDREYFLKILAYIDAEKAYEVASITIIDPHESDKMKVAALDLLSDLPAKKMHELIPMLKKAFSDSGNDNVRCRVIEILGKSVEKGIISFLWSSYEIPTSSMKVKAAALSAFGEIKDAHQLDKLWTVFQDTQEKAALHNASFYAIYDIGGDEKHVPQLLELMKDKEYSLSAAILLGNMGKKEALPVLLDGAKSTGSYSNLDNFLIDPLIKIGKPAVDEIAKLLS